MPRSAGRRVSGTLVRMSGSVLTPSPTPFAQHLWAQAPSAPAATASEPVTLRVLASGSSGNCTVLVRGSGALRRVTIIDCGLSPLRTRRLLAELGLTIDRVDDLLVTHLDTDHFHPGWIKALPRHARLHLHQRHIRRAVRSGIETTRIELFSSAFSLPGGVTVTPSLVQHDAWGVVAFRFDMPGASLGFATDVGAMSRELVSVLRGVQTLAIESNYCPRMQLESSRPEFLKRRIMGGKGHLSNEQCAQAVADIGTAADVVLLHLSRQCNTPERACALHAGAPYRVVVTSQHQPAPEVTIRSAKTLHSCGGVEMRAG